MRAIACFAVAMTLAVVTGLVADDKQPANAKTAKAAETTKPAEAPKTPVAKPADTKAEPIDAKKLIGKWEQGSGKTKMTTEYLPDGKVKGTIQFEGSYKVEGNKLIVTATIDHKEETMVFEISKLTPTEMQSTCEKGIKHVATRAGGDKNEIAKTEQKKVEGTKPAVNTIDPKKLIGKWEKGQNPKIINEFMPAGKFSGTVNSPKPVVFAGVYKVEGDKISVTATLEGKEHTWNWVITSLSDGDMELRTDKGQVEKLKRLK
jgi:uncharacterized protein (TIGR03066 family)